MYKKKRKSLGPELISGYKLFLDKLKFSYDSFDRIVLNEYIIHFHKSTNLCYYFKVILGHRFFNKKLRFELTCNHLPDIKMKKALESLLEFEKKAEGVLDRYSETGALMLNCHAHASMAVYTLLCTFIHFFI